MDQTVFNILYVTSNDPFDTIFIYFPKQAKGKPQIYLQWKSVNTGTLKILQKGPSWHPQQMNFK